MRSEGFITSMGDERAASSFALTSRAAKIHGVEPRQIFESKTSTNSSVKKRSYRRALQRARKHGYTWYRGKLRSAHQMGVQMDSIPEKRTTTNVEPPKYRQRRRLTCFSWNCSGLSPPEWDMLQIWLDSQAIDVIMLQETHWSYTREWLQEKYYAIHSGAQTRQAGLLCLISKQTCRQHDISWQEVIPGRILHVRLHGVARSVDLINLYQHVFQPCNLEYRSELWLKLSHLLSTFSKKNALILAGDANCSTDQRCSAVGYPTYARHGQRHYGSLHTDSHIWTQMLKQFNLIALNTWSPCNGATYEFNHQHSRIDYIIVDVNMLTIWPEIHNFFMIFRCYLFREPFTLHF